MQQESPRPFLSAYWKYLAMLNYEADPAALRPLLPRGTELDSFRGTTYISVVGFLFLRTSVWGIPALFFRNFEEVNLRFYVRRASSSGLRRGVVFVKEIVPHAPTAWIARTLYHERYIHLPMQHRIVGADAASPPQLVEYTWRVTGRRNTLRVEPSAAWQDAAPGSAEEFISEHYWGYTTTPGGGSSEYRVDHPRWRIAGIARAELDCDAAALYGPQLAAFLHGPPASAFLAEGSAVRVFHAEALT